MTYWHEGPYDGKDEWHWLGIAISTTTSIQNRAAIVELNARDQKVWNRVWWCCFTRDRLLSFGLRRTPRIKEDDGDSFTTPTLALDDFEIRKIDEHNLAISIAGCRVVQDTAVQLQLAKTFMAKAELCICIGHVLKTQYYSQIRDQGVGRVGLEPNRRPNSREALLPNPNPSGFEACRDELLNWLQNLPPDVMHTTPNFKQLSTDGNSLVIEKAVLHTIFLATLSTLNRPRALLEASTGSSQEHNNSKTISARIIREASADITSIYMDLYKLNLTRFLPTTAVTVLLPAIISHIQTIKTSSNEVPIWKEATIGLAQCMRILQELRENYQPADESMHMLEKALKHANIQIATEPMPSSISTSTFLSREEQSAEHPEERHLTVEPESFEFWHALSPPKEAVRRYESALKSSNNSDSDFQAIDPAVSLLSEELAWLDEAFTSITHSEPVI
jgi:hypothetical protein